MDWAEARYAVTVTLRTGGAVIEHHLEDASDLQRLIDDGAAEWVTELRCPRTLLSRQQNSTSTRQQVTWNQDEIAGDIYLMPGLVAVRDARVVRPTSLDSVVWSDTAELAFPTGWWLAKGEVRSVTPLLVSLVRFVRDADGRLGAGQMSVEEASDGPSPYFRVILAAELYDKRRRARDVQIAGLVAAFGLLRRSTMGEGGANADSQIANRLRAELEHRNVPDWHDEHFDPARAATALEAFHVGDASEDLEDG